MTMEGVKVTEGLLTKKTLRDVEVENLELIPLFIDIVDILVEINNMG